MLLNNNFSDEIGVGTFYRFTQNLLDVARSEHATIENEQEFEKTASTVCDYAELDKTLPKLTFVSVISKIHHYVSNKLVIYAAAKKTGDCAEIIAKHYLKTWQIDFDAEINQLFDSQHNDGEDLSAKHCVVAITKKLKFVVQQIKLPVYQDQHAAYREFCEGLHHVFSKEVVYLKLKINPSSNCMPPHVFPLLQITSPNPYEEYLIDKYAYLQKGLSFTKEKKAIITDENLKIILNKLNNLEFLDVSGCPLLTGEFLMEGHQKLKKIDLRKNKISGLAIVLELFPNLKPENALTDKVVSFILENA